ncbi:hypothetical protein AG1IA_03590 [Rhizoctonia solani AG-1 IA]|uniref:Uncharacterized protein n=1 Tax=Thanatephorus cucumeris (strain AG1-IA) TaxID=983506 RepID=L8WWM9_THACA|nr:hypothetical protein AG1IA_03590 [Rhizoctonia solani AG-1 IA]
MYLAVVFRVRERIYVDVDVDVLGLLFLNGCACQGMLPTGSTACAPDGLSLLLRRTRGVPWPHPMYTDIPKGTKVGAKTSGTRCMHRQSGVGRERRTLANEKRPGEGLAGTEPRQRDGGVRGLWCSSRCKWVYITTGGQGERIRTVPCTRIPYSRPLVPLPTYLPTYLPTMSSPVRKPSCLKRSPDAKRSSSSSGAASGSIGGTSEMLPYAQANVHFPTAKRELVKTRVTHSPASYDRSPIVVLPNSCALPARGCPGSCWCLVWPGLVLITP